MLGDRRFDRPFAGIVSDEGDMGGAAGLDQHGVAPVGLPAVVHRVQEARDMAPRRTAWTTAVLLAMANMEGAPRGMTTAGFGAQSTTVTPFSAISVRRETSSAISYCAHGWRGCSLVAVFARE